MQTRLTPEVMLLTGTVTYKHYYMHRFVPFGAKCAPQWFQMAMNDIFTDLISKGSMAVFVDDIGWWADTPEECLALTRDIFNRLRQRRLRVSSAKTVLAATEIEICGHIVSTTGRKLANKAMRAIADLKAPSSRKEPEHVRGFFNYCRNYIDHLAVKMAPLTELKTKTTGRQFTWTAADQNVFDTLKTNLMNNLELINFAPTDQHRLILRTDASNVGCGGCLIAKHDDGRETPICFFSRNFSDVQRRWSTVEQELYAILYCLTQYGYSSLLKSCRFMIENDHRNLVYLHRLGDHNKKLTHWKMILQEFDFDVVHIAGHTNGVSDALSRLLSSDTDEVNFIESTNVEEQHKTIMEACHAGITGGHQHAAKTIEVIKQQGLQWPNMEADVTRFCQTCLVCQKTKPRPHQITIGTTDGEFSYAHLVRGHYCGFP